MSPYDHLTLSRFLMEDPILLAMHKHERAWGDLLCDDFQDWKQNVAELCAPALKEVVALYETTPRYKIVSFADPMPSRVASPLFTEPAIAAMRAASPLFVEPATKPMRAASPLFTEPVRVASPLLVEPAMTPFTVPMVTALFAAARSASPLFTEPIPAPIMEVKHAYFATNSSIVPADPSPFVLPAPSVPQAAGVKTIIARNLPRDISPHDLRERFQLYGVVRDVYLPRNKDINSLQYGTVRGFALIKYDTAAQSARAVRVLSTLGLSIRGKQVTVEFAKSDTATRT
jgi:hypothetical protein